MSCPQLVGGLAESADEETVGFPELAAGGGAEGMEERRGGSLLRLGAMVGVLAQDRRGSQRLTSGACEVRCGLLCDLMDEPERAASPGFLGQVLPAGEG
jgi:hypothetical protein